METYKKLCTQYYDLDKPTALLDELAFYLEYAKEARGPILEPMCGTGRFLIPILERGFDIEGTDASAYMLTLCYDKCHRKSLKAKLYQEYLHQMALTKQYALIFIPSGSFGLITSVLEAKKCLQILYDHLLPNGKLVFEIETISAIPTELNIHQQRKIYCLNEDDKISLKTLSSYHEQDQIVQTICRYDLIQKNQVVLTETEDFRVRYYKPKEIDKWLEDIGFKNIVLWKAYNRAETDSNAGTIIYECTHE